MNERFQHIKNVLQAHGQAHLLAFYEELNETEQACLLEQLYAQDWDELGRLIESEVLNPKAPELPAQLEPAPYYPRQPSDQQHATYSEAKARGEALLRSGRVAAFTVAGGQGTRLGWDGPKGTFPATPLEGKPLFQVFAEGILKARKKYGAPLPWYLMTSRLNDADTRAFFAAHDYFGLPAADVMFFQQGSMPSIGQDGRVLLADKASLSLNPDGHGGSLLALARSGALDDMARRGVSVISYFQVDNPNVKPLDPLFLGLHDLEGAEMSAKMLPKVDAAEKVGTFCLMDGSTGVIEYSDIPPALAEMRDERGELKYNAGSIAIHLLSTDFVRRLNDTGHFALPYHRAIKKIPYLDPDTGKWVQPKKPNAVKLEAFVFDALPLARNTVLLETDRTEEFAPIKNAEGSDSPATSRQLQSQRAAHWLQAKGVEVPFDHDGQVDAVIELSPLSALEPDDLQDLDLPKRIERGEKVSL